MRTIIIGDIHGCYDELRALLDKAKYALDCDRIVCVGDLIDKGPDSFKVVEFLCGLEATCVLGNHEEKFVRYHKHEQRKLVEPNYKNPMRFSEDKLLLYQRLTQELKGIEWFQTWGNYLVLNDWMVVHAGLIPGIPLANQDWKQALRVRYLWNETGKMAPINEDLSQPEGTTFWAEKWAGPGHVIYGHTAADLEKVRSTISPGGMTWGIDTGCAYGGHLSALVFRGTDDELPQVVQVKAKKQYAPYYEQGGE